MLLHHELFSKRKWKPEGVASFWWTEGYFSLIRVISVYFPCLTLKYTSRVGWLKSYSQHFLPQLMQECPSHKLYCTLQLQSAIKYPYISSVLHWLFYHINYFLLSLSTTNIFYNQILVAHWDAYFNLLKAALVFQLSYEGCLWTF